MKKVNQLTFLDVFDDFFSQKESLYCTPRSESGSVFKIRIRISVNKDPTRIQIRNPVLNYLFRIRSRILPAR